MSEAAQQQMAVQRAGLVCRSCASPKLHRSHARGIRERIIKWYSGTRAWRCDQCGARQLSDLRPARRRDSAPELSAQNVRPPPEPAAPQRVQPIAGPAETPAQSFRPNPGPDPKPAPSPEPHPSPAPLPDPHPRRTRRKDPLAERLKARRLKRNLVTAVLVVLAGLGGAAVVMRTSAPTVHHDAE